MRPRALRLALVLTLTLGSVLGVVSSGCASATTLEHVWRSPEWTGSFTHIAIFGMSKRPGLRRDFETRMAAALANVGVEATPSHELFPNDGELDDKEIATKLEERGIDGVLVTRLVGIDHEHRYVPGSPYAVVGGPPPSFYGFYHGTYAILYSPGYTLEYDILTVETNLYDASTSELVWSGLSETFDPRSVDEAIESYAQTMVTTLVMGDLVTRTITPGAIESHD